MRRDIHTEFKAPPVAGGAASTLAFAITYRSSKPATTARVANALADFYLEEDVKLRGRKAGEAVQVLKEQLDDVTRKLQEQRQKLKVPGRMKMQMQMQVPARELVPATATSLSQVPQQQAKQPPVPAPPQQHPASQATGSPSLR